MIYPKINSLEPDPPFSPVPRKRIRLQAASVTNLEPDDVASDRRAAGVDRPSGGPGAVRNLVDLGLY